MVEADHTTCADAQSQTASPSDYDELFDRERIERAIDYLTDELSEEYDKAFEWESVEYNWGPEKERKTYEYVYHIYVAPGIAIRVFSSVDKRTDEGRAKGRDAIRVQLVRLRADHILATTPHTKRIKMWRKNLRKKVHAVADVTENMRECPKCGGYLRYVRGHDFFGCSNYDPNKPDDGCTYTSNI